MIFEFGIVVWVYCMFGICVDVLVVEFEIGIGGLVGVVGEYFEF